MNQKFLSGFTATLLLATLGVLPSYADQVRTSTRVSSDGSAVEVSAPAASLDQASNQASSLEANSLETAAESEANTEATRPQPAQSIDEVPPSESHPSASQPVSSQEAVKVGEYQSQEQAAPDETITTVHSHELAGRQAATLYIRDIPVLTFLGAEAADASSTNTTPANAAAPKTASAADSNASVNSASPDTKVGSQDQTPPADATAAAPAQPQPADPADPLWRATEIAARLNQFHHDSLDASSITAVWDEQQKSYLIKAGDQLLVHMTADTILPNTTQDPSEDALQATNLIRRQVGNAPPLQDVVGEPEVAAEISLGPVRFSVSGWASWYGPGFDGNYSASGEVFNQNALTAAHPDLPFGTQVRVTNMDNGESVVVRINDRGPYAGDRIIDLSRGAAASIGLVQSGVAPVKLEVLGSTAR